MKKIPHIKEFKDIVKRVNYFCEKYCKQLPILEFVGRTKLQGSSVYLQRLNNEITAYNKNRVLTTEYDGHNFANYINSLPTDILNMLFDDIGTKTDDIVIYGEWINKSSTNDKVWVIYSYSLNDVISNNVDNIYNHQYNIHNINQLPFFSMHVDFNCPQESISTFEQHVIESFNNLRQHNLFKHLEINSKEMVWYWKNAPEDTTMWFKTKTEMDDITSESIMNNADLEKIISYIVNTKRLQQALNYTTMNISKSLNQSYLNLYLKWIKEDILTKEVDILSQHKLQWKDISKPVTNIAKQWFLTQI